MDAKVESPSSPSRCKSLYDNGPVEWKTDVYYPFNTAYNNNNKASCTHVMLGDRVGFFSGCDWHWVTGLGFFRLRLTFYFLRYWGWGCWIMIDKVCFIFTCILVIEISCTFIWWHTEWVWFYSFIKVFSMLSLVVYFQFNLLSEQGIFYIAVIAWKIFTGELA